MENWIEVKGNEPPMNEYVLLLLEGETLLKGRLCSNGWFAFFADGEKTVGTREVTHWMYLPALPGKEQKQQPKLSRDEIAAMAMQGLLSNPDLEIGTTRAETTARDAVEQADALLAELSKPQP